eukprot:jgi/Undpi1/2457/HiC_scaffold_13.g05837.m1
MKLSAIGLTWFASFSSVSGFVSQAIPTVVNRSFQVAHKTPQAFMSQPLSRPHRPQAQRSAVMKQEKSDWQGDGAKDRPVRAGKPLTGLGKRGGFQKAALLLGATAATVHVLPHAAVAAETALPLVSAAVDGTLMDRLTTSGFFQAFSLVFVSEIGDKTFFIAALLAAKTSRLISFAGSVGALAVMTVLAVLLGLAFHSVPSVFTSGLPIDDIVAAAAFLYFGLNTLKDAFELPDDSNEGIDEERAEAEESVKELESKKTVWALILQTFSLVFAAEFGDRSFLTTIALGAAQNPFGVATGAIVAHASATGIAVTGGALLSQYISEKVIGYIGGTLFVVFSITTAVGIF